MSQLACHMTPLQQPRKAYWGPAMCCRSRQAAILRMQSYKGAYLQVGSEQVAEGIGLQALQSSHATDWIDSLEAAMYGSVCFKQGSVVLRCRGHQRLDDTQDS